MSETNTNNELHLYSAAELLDADLPEIVYPVEDLVPVGETVLAAPPKTGKSWLALDMAICIATGEPFLGYKTLKSGVIYYCLEDCEQFAKERLKTVLDGKQPPVNLHLAMGEARRIGDGFFEKLDSLLGLYPGTKVVIVDTMQHIVDDVKSRESAYAHDYRMGKAIKSYADARNLAVVVITHTTKLKHSDDLLLNISGTNGVIGAADACLVIDKDRREDRNARLFICGRRVKETSLNILFQRDTCKWVYQGMWSEDDIKKLEAKKREEEYMNSAIREAVIKIAQNNPTWKGSSKKLIDDAAAYGTGIVESSKDVGRFLSSRLGEFMRFDQIRVEIIKNGNGSNQYRITEWHIVDGFVDEQRSAS